MKRHPAIKKISWLVMTLFYMAAVIALSTKPVIEGPAPSTFERILHNLCHIPIYAVLCYLLTRCSNVIDRSTYAGAFVISFLFGVLNEYLQTLVPSREASVGDMLLNALGTVGMIWILKKNKQI